MGTGCDETQVRRCNRDSAGRSVPPAHHGGRRLGLVADAPARVLGRPTENDLARSFADARSAGLDTVADVGTFLGETVVGAVVLLVVGAGFAVWQRAVRPLLYVVVTYGGLGLVYLAATHVDTRQRPPVRILDPG